MYIRPFFLRLTTSRKQRKKQGGYLSIQSLPQIGPFALEGFVVGVELVGVVSMFLLFTEFLLLNSHRVFVSKLTPEIGKEERKGERGKGEKGKEEGKRTHTSAKLIFVSTKSFSIIAISSSNFVFAPWTSSFRLIKRSISLFSFVSTSSGCFSTTCLNSSTWPFRLSFRSINSSFSTFVLTNSVARAACSESCSSTRSSRTRILRVREAFWAFSSSSSVSRSFARRVVSSHSRV